MPDSQSASERGGSAKREKPPRTRLASSGGQLTQRSERDARRANARAALERNEALVWRRKTGRFFKSLAPGVSVSGQHTKAARRPAQRAQPLPPQRIFGRKRPEAARRAVAVRHAKRSARGPYGYRQQSYPRHPAPGAVGRRKTELGGNTPSPKRPPKKTPHGPPISSQSGYQRALQRRGVGGRGGPSDSLFLALPGALRARLASRRGEGLNPRGVPSALPWRALSGRLPLQNMVLFQRFSGQLPPQSLFHGILASTSASPQKPVTPANTSPAPTKAVSQNMGCQK